MTAKTVSTRPVVAILAALVMVLALLAGADPARAQTEAGTGVAKGTEEPAAQTTAPPSFPLCLEVSPNDGDVLYDLTGQGTYTGGSGSVIYSTSDGPDLDIKIKANEHTGSFWINPAGTFRNPNCELGGEAPGTAGIPVDVTVHAPGFVRDSTASTAQECDGSGTYGRANSTFVAEWRLDQTCHVQGTVFGFDGPGTAPAGTLHTFDGHITPCEPATCDALEGEEAQLAGTYEQALH